MYTLLKPLQVREALLERNIHIFTVQDFCRLFHLSSYKRSLQQLCCYKTKYFLEEQTRQGLLLRLKQGIYALKTDPPSEEEIANALYKPSYISFEYALAYYGIIPERPYSITSATTKSTAQFSIADKAFAYYTIKKEAYTGYTLIKGATKAFLIAEPEKALVDYLYFVVLGKRGDNDRVITKNLGLEKLRTYAKLFKRPSLEKLITKTYANN